MPISLRPKLNTIDNVNTDDLNNTHEVDLLLCCISTQFGIVSADSIHSLLQKTTDWSYLVWLANHHGVIPILYKTLYLVGSDVVPPSIWADLKIRANAIAGHNLFLTLELVKLLRWLKTHDIKAIPFKGPILAAAAYGDLSLRQFSDLDILIHQKDAAQVKQLLLNNGYEQASHIASNAAYEALYLRSACEYNFLRKDGRVAVEPHWDFVPKKLCIALNSAALWQRLDHIVIAGNKVPKLSWEDALLVICINGMKDHWSSLKTIVDVAALVQTAPLDWDVLLKRAKSIGCQRILWMGLYLAQSFLGATIPEIILQRSESDAVVVTASVQIRDRLFNPSPESSTKMFGGNFSTWYLQMRERPQDNVRYVFNLVFGPNEGDAESLPLPPFLHWIYPCLRPFRLIARLALSLL